MKARAIAFCTWLLLNITPSLLIPYRQHRIPGLWVVYPSHHSPLATLDSVKQDRPYVMIALFLPGRWLTGNHNRCIHCGFPHHGFKVWFKPLEMYYLCIGDWIIWCVLKFWNKHDLSLTQIISWIHACLWHQLSYMVLLTNIASSTPFICPFRRSLQALPSLRYSSHFSCVYRRHSFLVSVWPSWRPVFYAVSGHVFYFQWFLDPPLLAPASSHSTAQRSSRNPTSRIK